MVIFSGGVDLAFSDFETGQIYRALLAETRRCAVTFGMRKTSVDQLTQAVGISKGSFYRFFVSKELLFFAVLEDIHTELYDVADGVLRKNAGLPPAERAAEAILAVCRRMAETGVMTFIENDVAALLQRLPENVKAEHYHDDETHIRDLLGTNSLSPKGGAELATAAVRGLILTISHKEQIGELYPKVLDILVHGACTELFS